MVRTDAFVRSRTLTNLEVTHINYILKSRAHRFVAVGRQEWLYPERQLDDIPWAVLRGTLLPPKGETWLFGGEILATFKDGRVYYRDQFGRTEKQRDFLRKEIPERPLKRLCRRATARD
jgi:hypothetical protein